MMSSQSHYGERVESRLTIDEKILLNRAAVYSNMSLSRFLISAASERAKEIVAEHEVFTLSAEDWTVFLAALDDTSKPRPKLKAAVRRYLKRLNRKD